MDERLTTIKGIGPGREKQLHKLGITNITSLLTYFPRTYEDRRTIYRIGDLKSGMTGGVVGNVIAVQEKRPRPRIVYFRSSHCRWYRPFKDCAI